MFCDIKDRLSDPVIRNILSCCLFDNSPVGIEKALTRYEGEQFYGWLESGEPLGICGFRVLQDNVEICHIAVAENARGKGIGSAMVAALRDKYSDMNIQVETDDGAVDFYRKCGFEAIAFYKQYDGKDFRRWTCVLQKMRSQETDEERRARIYPIILCEYNPTWREWFAEEKANLERLVGIENIVKISHIGSTAVPGLVAKPTVDILLEIHEDTDIDNLISTLPSSDYICLNEAALTLPTPPPHLMFLKGYLSDGFAEKVYHIHVRYPNDWDELRFRDYLIAHPETAAEYADLKHSLFKNYEHDRDGYTNAKSLFVKNTIIKAREEALT